MKKVRMMFAVVLLLAVIGNIVAFTVKRSINGSGAENEESLVENDPSFDYINNNIPLFSEEEIKPDAFESYSELDSLGRAGTAFACVGKETMPTEKRGNIGMIKPSGWQIAKYDFIDGKYLYNRCHLIAYQLTGENDNKKNLITGTRYMNTVGMMQFENSVADYVKKTGNHVLYRVTPFYNGEDLLANGLHMEAYSVEDEGRGVSFNVFVYNIQPGVEIDYKTGDNHLSSDDRPVSETEFTTQTIFQNEEYEEYDYVVNTNSKKFHYSTCASVGDIKDNNKELFSGSRDELIKRGMRPCGACKP